MKKYSVLLLFFLFSSFVVVPTASAACPEVGSAEFGDVGQQIQLIACTDEGLTGQNQAVTIETPVATLPGAAAASAVGDLLIAVVQTDGGGETLNNVANYSADWTPAIGTPYISSSGISSMIWTRIADGTEGNHTFGWNSNEQVYGYILRFTGASGLYQMAANGTGTSNTPTANAVNANAINSLILRMISTDRRGLITQDVNPGPDDGGTLITLENSRPTGGSGNGTVTGGASYSHQAGTGTSSGVANFNNPNVFSLNEGWHSRTMAIEPYEFRFSMPDSTAGVCGVQLVTLSVTDSNGAIPSGSPMESFAGLVTISATSSAGATWADGPGLSNSITDNGNGNATYQFSAADNGTAVFEYYNPNLGSSVDFDVSFGNFGESTNYTSPQLDIINCEFVVTNDVGDEVATCAMEAVTITLRDTDGNPADTYSGTLSIDNGSGDSFGNYVLNAAHTGAGALNDAIADDGKATYTFALTPSSGSNVLVLDYIHSSADLTSIDFAISEDSGDNYLVASITSLDVINCAIIVTLPDADLTRDVCTMTRVTFEIQAGGAAVTNFSGTLSIATSAGQGLWFENALETYPGTFTGGGVGNGTASYDFNGTEAGTITFDFRNQLAAANLSFTATGLTDEGIALPQSGPAPEIDIVSCTLTITTANATVGNLADVCRSGEIVTYTLTGNDGAATGYTGTVFLQTDSAAGNYALDTGGGTLTDGGGNDGSASYEFVAGDNGVFSVDYSVLAAPVGGVVTLTAISAGASVVNTDGTFTFRDCVFNISYPADTAPFETDVCSIKQVRIDLVDFDGDPVTNYTGTINLSTSTGFGSWAADVSANGSLSDPFGEDGSASYTFVDLVAGTDPGDDDGVVLLNFTHTAAAAAAVNINVSDSVTSDPGSPGTTNDPNLAVDLCTFQISFDGGGVGSTHSDVGITACEVQAVTIEVFDSLGALATNYTGEINVSTSTNNGNWAVNTGTNALTNVVVDGGAVSYLFDTADNGVVTLDFSDQNAETVNIDVVDEVIALGLDGVMVEEGAADPSLEIGSCIPAIANRVCSVGGSPLTFALPITAQNGVAALQGRMVAVATVHENTSVVNSVSFDSVLFNVPGQAQLLKDIRLVETGNDSYTSLWVMNEQLLPTAAGSFNVVVNHTDTSLAACAFFMTDVEQTFPVENLVTPADGPVNATSSADNNVTTASTIITTSKNNALVLSIVGIGNPADTTSVSPSPPMVNFSPQPPDPSGAGFGGASGNASTAASITIDQDMSINPTFRHTHVVAAFNPLIDGPAVAEGFEPVVLFQTYSGNLSYRAIGASFQDGPNGLNTCSLVSPLEATANLQLPDAADIDVAANGAPFSAAGEFDSDVQAAWLYWFASGSFDLPNMDGFGAYPNTKTPANFDNVTFSRPNGLGGFNVTNITADDVFVIENVGGNNNSDFYVGYRDVTSLLVGTDNEQVIGVGGHTADGNPNGDYTISNMEIDDNLPWISRGACAGGFALVVVYENTYEQLRVINLFHGFQPFQNSAFTLVPRNFRIAARDTSTNTPNGQVTHITVEGDVGLSGANEALTIQETPGDFDTATFNGLITDFNPAQEEFNGTISRPVYGLTDVFTGGTGEPSEYKYIFDNSSGANGNPSNGYELDFPNPAVFPFVPPGAALTTYGLSYGVDIDTHFIDGDEVGDILYEFADPSDLAEEITTRYAADQDLVLLVAEIISVTNAPIADIEVTVTEADATYKVGSTGVYNIEVKNNGNGAITFGEATGIIELVGELPAGMTFSGGSEITGTGWVCTDSADSNSRFTCTYDISANLGIGGLGDASLPLVSATVTIASPPASFPSLNNDAKVIVRVAHSDGTCLGGSTGFLPIPTSNCEAPEFDNVNDLEGGALDINDLDDKSGGNNNVHSFTTNVRGIETDLSVVKSVVTVLEEGSSDTTLYTITVTNNGPDDIVGSLTQPAITITDNEPVGINFDSASGTNWDCTVNTVPNPDQLVCTFDNLGVGSIANGASSVITVVGDVTGSSPTPVTNTVQVSSGTYNFDNVPGNNTSQDTTNISAVPAAVTDRFLLSVSAVGNVSLGSGGGLLSNFNENDIILYDPQADSAEYFIDSTATAGYSVTDPNAIHLLPNGQVLLSASTDANTIGVNGTGTTAQAFDKDDIVLYDKLRNSATLLFDGSALITDDAMDAIDLDIDSAYVLPDGTGRIIFSTAGPATATEVGGVSWSDSDLVIYDKDAVGLKFSIYLNAEDTNVFGVVDAQVDAAYLRIDPDDSTKVLDTFVLSSAVPTILGDDNVALGLDDVAEISRASGTLPNPDSTTSTNLFNGNIPLGVFDTTDLNLRLNALHLIETAHLGHFSVAEFVVGDACTPVQLKITKHRKLLTDTHVIDTDYVGSVKITTDTVDGIWSVVTGTGTLDNSYGGGADNGQALYTFAPGDNGEVILSLNVTQVPPVIDSVDVSVTNGFSTDEDNTGPFNFSLKVTIVDYADNFDLAAINNNDGSAAWTTDWVEIDALNATAGTGAGTGFGMSTGNIQITGGKLSLTSNLTTDGGAVDPSMTRAAGLGLFSYVEPVLIKYDYGYQSANAAGDVIELQISNDDADYITVQTYDSLDGSSGSDIDETIDISAFISDVAADDIPDNPNLIIIDPTDANLYVRWVLVSGYVGGTFTVDNFQVTTSTNACSTGSLNHYDIIIPDTGLACVASTVQIVAHDFAHDPVEVDAGTVLSLSTSNNSGTWANILAGGGSLSDIGGLSNTDGMGSYTFPGGTSSVSLAFNYTDPAGDGSTVNIDVTDGTYTEIKQTLTPFDDSHDPDSDFALAGLLFYDEAASTNFTQLPFQIAGKPSMEAPASGNVTLQIVRTVPIGGENASVACESIVGDGDVVTVTIAGLCIDPMGCDADKNMMSIVDSNSVAQAVRVLDSPTANPEQSGLAADITLQFVNQGTTINGRENIAADLNFSYPNSGKISLHAEYELPFEDPSATASGDTIRGASSSFIVRPFGFDIDFDTAGDDRSSNGPAPFAGSISYATDENGPAFARAGVGFDATVSAVQWQAVDDGNDDGIPDADADLSDNLEATNFGDEQSDTNVVIVSVRTDAPGVPTGVNGSMVLVDGSSDSFTGFTGGFSATQKIAIDEVGIFNLSAVLVDTEGARNPINYFNETTYTAIEGVVGGVTNVGRIYPNHFVLNSASFGPRINQSMTTACTMSPFTYMGEDFRVIFELEARNFQDAKTQNYFAGFAKLNEFDELDLRAIVDVAGAADIDYDAAMRLERTTFPAEFGLLTAGTTDDWDAGVLTLSGDLRLNRQSTGAEEAPLENVKIAFSPRDNNINDMTPDDFVDTNDVLLNSFNVDLDDNSPDVDPLVGPWQFAEIDTHEFRYGRLLVENAYGPEYEPLGIPIRIEYFDGTDFVLNTDDSCTAINQTFGAEELTFVAAPISSYETADGSGPFIDGVTTIEETANLAMSDVEITVFEGQTKSLTIDGDDDDENATDRPFTTSAPLNGVSGRVLVEFDLDPLDNNSSTSLHFLEYDWRGGVNEDPSDIYDEESDGVNYDDNPRATVEFGSYRGHDRVINWQEIYIGPTQNP